MTIAELGLKVDSSPVAKASGELEKLTAASMKAQAAATGLSSQTTAAAATARNLSAATDAVTTRMNINSAAVKANSAALQINAAAAQRASQNSRQLSFQLIDIGQALATAPTMGIYALQNLGFQVAQIGQIYMGQGGFNAAVRDSARQFGAFAARIGPAAAVVGALAAGIAGLTYEINSAQGVTVSFGDTALAVFQVISDAIYNQLQPAIQAIAPWFQAAWGMVVSGVKTAGNLFIAGWMIQFDALKTGVSAIPDAFIAAGEAAANGFLSAIEQMVREALVAINDLLTDVNGMLPDGYKLPLAPAPMSFKVGRVDIGGAAASGRLSDASSGFMDRSRAAASRDYMGEFFNAVETQAVANSLARTAEEAEKAGGAMKKAANDAADPWKGIRDVTLEQGKALEQAGRSAGGILKGLIDGTLEWEDALQQALSVALKLLNEMSVASGGSGLFGGGFLQGLLGGLLGFAKGGVFSGGNVVPFAKGGIVSRPTVFPFAKGVGLMGEAGPEAIMPLRRGADGRLGVASANGNQQPLRVELVSRFDADGGFETAVERTSRPIAQMESAAAASGVARAVPGMVDARNNERDVRRIRPRSAA